MLLFSLILAISVSASDFVFRNISTDDGLSSNTVSSICQDFEGNIWFATKGGVNRYNGYDVDVFKYSSDNLNTVQSNNINKVVTDWNGTVWVCSSDGLSYYDRTANLFHRVHLENLHSIEGVLQFDKFHLLLSTRSESYVYNMESGMLLPAKLDGKKFVFYGSYFDSGKVVAGTDRRNIEFIEYADGDSFRRTAASVSAGSLISDILPDGAGGYWVATRGRGLMRLKPGGSELEAVSLQHLPTDVIESMTIDIEGRIWIGTKHGICIYNPSTGEDLAISSDPYESGHIGSKAVRDVFCDSVGNIWVGSTYGGADVMTSYRAPFKTIRQHPFKPSLSDNIVRSLYAEPDSTVWVGTRYNGLNHFNPQTGEVKVVDIADHILSFYSPDARTLFVGTYSRGLLALDRRTLRVRTILPNKDINSMAAAKNGKVWVASLSGLYLLDPVRGTAIRSIISKEGRKARVIALLNDDRGRLWVGAKENLMVMEVGEDNSLTEVTDDALKDVVRTQVLFQGSDGTVWIGTTDGLFSFRDGVLTRASEESGLRDMTINGIVPDRNGMFWISTGNGLCRYNPQSGSGKFYGAADGLQGDDYSLGAICVGADGKVFAGGSRGLSYFNPDDVSVNSVTPPPYISRIAVQNGEIPLDGKIVLKHFQNTVSISFSCPDYRSAGQNTFKYRLEGFNDDWMETRAREIRYTNLDKGNYRFIVRAANRDGVWADKEASVDFRIRPKWYKTVAVQIIFCLLLFGGLSVFAIWIFRRSKRRYEDSMDRMKDKYEDDMRRLRLASYVSDGHQLAPDDEDFLAKAVRYIDDNVHNAEFSVEMLASFMCMSRSNLHLKFRRIAGTGPAEIIKRIRLERAKSLLRSGPASMTEAAEQCGFASLSYFSTTFKKATGMTPGEYASRARGEQ